MLFFDKKHTYTYQTNMEHKTRNSGQMKKEDQQSSNQQQEGVVLLVQNSGEFASRWDRESKEEETNLISGASQARFLADVMQRKDSERSLFENSIRSLFYSPQDDDL